MRIFLKIIISVILLVLLISLSKLSIDSISSCNNPFREKLIKLDVNSIEVYPDSTNKESRILLEGSNEVSKVINSINKCPRFKADEMSFQYPPNALMVLKGDKYIEVKFYNDANNVNLVFKDHYIRTELHPFKIGE